MEVNGIYAIYNHILIRRGGLEKNMDREVMEREYEAFFRNGGYRLMKLITTRAFMEPPVNGRFMDVTSLVRLQNGYDAGSEYTASSRYQRLHRIEDICKLDRALHMLLLDLPRNWEEVIDKRFGRNKKIRDDGTRIRKSTAESALASAIRKIERNNKGNTKRLYDYDFTTEGLYTVRKIMSYLHRAADIGYDISESMLMKAVTSMKLFRNSRQGILYTDALEEFQERLYWNGLRNAGYASEFGEVRIDEIETDILIREEVDDGQQLTGLESKVRKGRSSILIDRMYEMYGIMEAIKEYLPDKYERIMSFHWTHSEEKLTELFLEVAAMLIVSEETSGYMGIIDY